MSRVSYDEGSMTISLEGLEDVEEKLGTLKNKSRAAVKVALNATAREARKRMIAGVKQRYAINSKGIKYVKVLRQNRKATNANLNASLYIKTPRNDLGYFRTNPKEAIMGRAALSGPEFFKAKVLKSSSMKRLTGTMSRFPDAMQAMSGGRGFSKGFLVKFKSTHTGMVQRVIGSDVSSH